MISRASIFLTACAFILKMVAVAHTRSSGNAPQLRICANSDSQARADEIAELALREPDGILRQLERAFTQGTVATCEGEPTIPVYVQRRCHSQRTKGGKK
jgi:Tfp pilus assembly protein PilX